MCNKIINLTFIKKKKWYFISEFFMENLNCHPLLLLELSSYLNCSLFIRDIIIGSFSKMCINNTKIPLDREVQRTEMIIVRPSKLHRNILLLDSFSRYRRWRRRRVLQQQQHSSHGKCLCAAMCDIEIYKFVLIMPEFG